MHKELAGRIRKYVNAERPLGPADAHQIKDAEVAAMLFDPHNNSFNSLLNKNISVVIGRRGSGKTALLNSYLYRPYFGKALNISDEGRSDINDYKVVIPVTAHVLFERMQSVVAGTSGTIRPIESVIDAWADLLIDYVLATILNNDGQKSIEDDNIDILRRYISAPENKQRADAYKQVWGTGILDRFWDFLRSEPRDDGYPTRDEALAACEAYLASRRTGAVIIFDSMDEYEVGDPRMDRTVGALLRFVGQFNFEHERLKIKLGLPTEIFPEIQRASANPLKDFVSFDQVRWTSVELAQIAAYRYKLFLSIFDPQTSERVVSIELNHRDGARRFWEKFFPEGQVNRYGHPENAMTYMLRHTQLLPRQLFRILQRAIIASHRQTGTYTVITKQSVEQSIVNMEPIIAGEIIQGFKHVYPHAENLAKAVFGNLQTVFTYDELEDRWRKIGQPMMWGADATFELVNFTEMLLRMGIIGVFDSEKERYVESEFAYNMLVPFGVGSKMRFCIHPIFSRYFSCAPNLHKKSILPRGAALDGE